MSVMAAPAPPKPKPAITEDDLSAGVDAMLRIRHERAANQLRAALAAMGIEIR